MLWLDTGTHEEFLKASNSLKQFKNGIIYMWIVLKKSHLIGYISKENLLNWSTLKKTDC